MTRGSSEPKPGDRDRVLWLLLPGGHPVRASARGAEAARATAWCDEGDGTRGLPWRPMDQLDTKGRGGRT